MLNLTGTVINVFTQQGGTNKKASLLKIVTKYSCLVLWTYPMAKLKMSLLRSQLIIIGTLKTC